MFGGAYIWLNSSKSKKVQHQFHNFVGRLRANFRELIVKPLKLQMMVEFPEFKDDEIIMNQIDIDFNSNQIFCYLQCSISLCYFVSHLTHFLY